MLLSLAGAERTRVVVRDLASEPSLDAIAKDTTDAILISLSKHADLSVAGERELELLVEHRNALADLDACDGDLACSAQLAAALDADKIITGLVGRLGDRFVATLKLSDMKLAVFERGESCLAEDAKTLTSCMADAAVRLFARGAVKEEFRFTSDDTKLAVLELSAHGVPPSLAGTLTELLLLELKKTENISVISRAEVEAMLSYEADRQVARCESDIACLIEIGGALGVDHLVAGAIGKLDDTFVIHLKLMDVSKAEVSHRISESFVGNEQELARALRFASHRLLGRSPGEGGSVEVVAPIDEAEVSIDGRAPVALAEAKNAKLAPGKHTLSIRAEGYRPYHHEFYVEGDLTRVHAEPLELPSEWYELWWVWTIAGVVMVVAGSTAIGVSLTKDRGPPPDLTWEVR
jgi:TolB-like protein